MLTFLPVTKYTINTLATAAHMDIFLLYDYDLLSDAMCVDCGSGLNMDAWTLAQMNRYDPESRLSLTVQRKTDGIQTACCKWPTVVHLCIYYGTHPAIKLHV